MLLFYLYSFFYGIADACGGDLLRGGFDVYAIIEQPKIELSERNRQLYKAIATLTDKQRFVLLSHVLDEQPFRVIGEMLGLGTYTVRDYYYNAVKKLKKFLS